MGKRLFGLGTVILLTVAVLTIGWSLSRSGTPSKSAAATLAKTIRSASRGPARTRSDMRAGQRTLAGALSWRILSSYTARRIENAYLPAHASGIYLIVDVAAANGTNHAVTLNEAQVNLDARRYHLDASALSALELAGHKPLAGTLDPQETASGWLVFDVRPAAAAASPHICLVPRTVAASSPSCFA